MIRPSAGGLLDQFVERCGAPARREHQRAVFDERAGIADVLDVLARGALAGRAPTRDGLGTRRVECTGATLQHLGQVGADADRDRSPAARCVAPSASSCSSMKASGWPSNTVSPTATVMARTTPLALALITCCIFIASITRTSCPAPHRVAFGHADGHDRALHRRAQRHGAFGSGHRIGVRRFGCRPPRRSCRTARRPTDRWSPASRRRMRGAAVGGSK